MNALNVAEPARFLSVAEVPPGYKLTEIGIIPADWYIFSLGEISSFRTGPFGSALHRSDYIEGGIPLINPMHIVDGEIRPAANTTVTAQAARRLAAHRFRRKDIVIGRRGDMGRCAVIGEVEEGWLCGTGSLIIRCSGNVDASFIQRTLTLERVIKAIEDASVGSTMINLNHAALARLQIQCPPIIEQRAIAKALSDVDELLGALEALIAKKRAIKQGAMQQLLTGRTRLPSFHEPWSWCYLATVVDFVNGKPYETHIDPNGHNDLITLDSIGINGNLKSEHRRTGLSDNSLAKDDIVIILSDLAHGNLLGLCDLIPEDNRYVLNQRVGRLRIKPGAKANPQFVRLQINRQQEHFKKRGQGTSQRHIYRRDIDQLQIALPELDEQTAIADALSSMGVEIAALERQRDKARCIKQGMMQQLLTGRTRLVKPQPPEGEA